MRNEYKMPVGRPKERGYMEDLVIDGRFEWLRRCGPRYMWLRIGTRGGPFEHSHRDGCPKLHNTTFQKKMNFWTRLKTRNCLVVEWPLASQEGLFSMELVYLNINSIFTVG
jgi:hypothetical protein